MKKSEQALKSVNEIFKEENPSVYTKKTSKKNIDQIVESKKKFFLEKLKLPPKIFKNSSLLDLGCGSGQNSIFFDHMGSNCTLIDYDKKSIENTKKLFSKFGKKKFKLINQDIFKFKSKKKFDFVISSGVLQHTHDPIKGIKLAVKFLKKGGFFILGTGETNGYFQRNLQRLILYNLSHNNSDIIKLSKMLFKEHLLRSSKYGLRSIRQIIFDTYLNPKIHSLSFSEIEKVFDNNNLFLYSMDENNLNMKDIYNFKPNQFRILNKKEIKNKTFHSNYLLNPIINFSLSNNPDKMLKKNCNQIKEIIKSQNLISKKINDISFNNFKSKFFLKEMNIYYGKVKKLNKIDIIDKKNHIRFINEVIKILKVLKYHNQKTRLKMIKRNISKSSRLFRKLNGKGTNYFVGYKF